MPARVTFLLGRSGSGKTRRLHRCIKEALDKGRRVVVIVPEQFTFETERQLASELGGLMDIEVYSFSSLAEKTLEGSYLGFLSRQGRRMAVRKTITEQGSKLRIFARVKDRPGFSERLCELFTACKRYEVAPGDLLDGAEKAGEDSLLANKLTELALLYGETESYISGRYMDSEDMFAALIQNLPSSPIAGAEVVIDDFDLLTDQLYHLMAAMTKHAESMYISLRMDPKEGRDAKLFAPKRRAYARLYGAAQENGCDIRVIQLPDGNPKRQTDPALAHLEAEVFAYPYKIYGGEAPSLRIAAATSVSAECEMAAEAVLRCAQRGMRYRDMAVIATEPAYELQLLRSMQRRGIPCFSDGARKLSAYGAPRLVLSALKCVNRGYNLNYIMDMLRTGLTGIEGGDIDLFENYALRCGIGGTGFKKPFDQEIPEKVRGFIISRIDNFHTAFVNAPTARDKAAALFAFMESMGLYDSINGLVGRLRAEGRHQLAEENAQVYRLMLTVLDQLHAIMGEGAVSARRFAAILEEGFDAYEISAIPATADQLLLGTLGRTMAKSPRAMFILGANEGSFPHYFNDDGMINDRELDHLASMGAKTWGRSAEKAEGELMDLYCALAAPKELLYISYTMSAGTDAALPAPLVDRIREIFPKVGLHTDLEPLPPVSPEGGVARLAKELRAYGDDLTPWEGLGRLYAWYAGKPEYRQTLEGLEDALYYRCSPEPFGHELSLKLYGDSLFGSATRLERYNACPFDHFVTYGLRAAERREFRERPLDEGTFCHSALDSFVKEALKRDIKALSGAQCDEIIDGIMPPLMASHNNGVLLSSARNMALCARLIRKVKATARAIVQQVQSGGFVPEQTEVSFGMGGLPALTLELPTGERFYIGGRIDRIDGCTIAGQDYYRIIDYKTGSGDFSYTRLYYGLSLQLPLYAAAIGAVEKARRAAGMYYMKVDSPVVSESADTAADEEAVKEKVMESFRLSGLTLSDPVVVKATAGEGCPVISTGARTVIPEKQLDGLIGYALKKSTDTLTEIFEGRAAVSPAKLRSGSDRCKTCANRSVCGFDEKLPGCKRRSLGTLSDKAFFERIGAAEKNGDNGKEGGNGD